MIPTTAIWTVLWYVQMLKLDAINVNALLCFDEPIKLVLFFKQTNKQKIDMNLNCKRIKSVQFFRWLTWSLARLSPCTHSNAYRLLSFFVPSKTLFWKAISLDINTTNFSNWVIATMCAWCDSNEKKMPIFDTQLKWEKYFFFPHEMNSLRRFLLSALNRLQWTSEKKCIDSEINNKKVTSNYILFGLNFVDAMELRMQYQLYDCVQCNNELQLLCSIEGKKWKWKLKKTTLILFQAEFAYFSCISLSDVICWLECSHSKRLSNRFMPFFPSVSRSLFDKMAIQFGMQLRAHWSQPMGLFVKWCKYKLFSISPATWLIEVQKCCGDSFAFIMRIISTKKNRRTFFSALLWNIIPFWIPSHFAISLYFARM